MNSTSSRARSRTSGQGAQSRRAQSQRTQSQRAKSGENRQRTGRVRDELRDIQRSTRRRSDDSKTARTRSRADTQSRNQSGSRVKIQSKNAQGTKNTQGQLRSAAAPQGGLLFFLGVILLLIATLNIVLVFRSYAHNVGQLNSLKNQEAQLIQQKSDLENDISRWSDDAYVTAQARKRLGFVYPGERSVLVKNAPEDAQQSSDTDTTTTTQPQLPWYTELMYAIENADQANTQTSSSTSSTQDTTANPVENSQENSQDNTQTDQQQQ